MLIALTNVLRILFRHDREMGNFGIPGGASTNGQRSPSRAGCHANGIQNDARSIFQLRNHPGTATRAR